MNQGILLVDDDTDDRLMFCEALEEVAPDITCSPLSNGRNALAKLNNGEIETPDLIFLDINMPLINGWQCLTMFKQQDIYKHIPVVMYSTTCHAEEIEKAYKLGALCFFTKPSNYKELKKSLAVVVEHLQKNSLSSLMLNSPLFIVPKKS